MSLPLLSTIDEKLQAQGAQMGEMCTTGALTNTKLQAMNDNLDLVKSSLVSINQNTDTLEALVAATTAAINAMWTNRIPADCSTYQAALSLAGNPTVLNAPGTVYAVTSSGNMTIRDNTTDKVQVPGGVFFILPVPLVCATSIKLFAVLASNTTLWFRPS